MDFDWHGLEELVVAFDNAGPKARTQASAVVKNSTEKLKSRAQQLAPVAAVDGGYLKSQIKSSYPNDLEGHVKGEAAYEGYQEYGTRFQPGTPHIRPALKEVEPEFKKGLDNALKGAFK